jgi:hypothetical protein
MPNAELAIAMDISRKDLETLLSQMRKRWCDPRLFEDAAGDGVAAASADSLALLERAGRILDGRGGVFFALGGAPPVEDVTCTTLHPDRPPIDREAKAQKLARLRTLKGEQLKIAVAATAKELAWDPADLAAQLPKATQHYLRKEAARERFREELTPLMEKYPKRSPKPLRALFKEACERIDGLTREICEYVIDEVAEALLREKGLKTSWREPGAPKRG